MKKLRAIEILIIITVIFIWGQSVLPGSVSAVESGWVMELVRPVLGVIIGEANVTVYLIRKLAHFTEFFALGAELAVYFGVCRKAGHNTVAVRMLRALGCGLAVAAVDETIQLFAEGRGASIVDVCIDFSGVAAAVIVVWIFRRIKCDTRGRS